MLWKQFKNSVLNSSLITYFKPFFGFLSGDIISYLIDLLTFTLIARMVGTEGYGYLAQGTSTTIWLEISILFGFNIIGAAWVAKDPNRTLSVLRNVLIFRLVIAVILSVGLGIFSTLWEIDPVYRQILIARIVILVGTALNISFIFIGLGRPLPFAVTNILWRIAYFLLLFTIFASQTEISLYWIPLTNGVIMVVVNVALLVWTLRNLLKYIPHNRSDFDINLRQMIREGIPVTVSDMAHKGYNLNVLLLTIWATTAQVGSYAAATRILNVLLFVLVALLRTFGPRLAVISRAKDRIYFDRAFNRYRILCFGIGISGALFIYLLAKPAVVWVLDSSFENAGVILQIYSLYFLVIAFHTPYSSALPFIGEQNQYLVSNILGLGVNFVSNLIFIPLFGYIGASFTAIIGGATILVYAYISFRRWYGRFNWANTSLELAYD